MRTDYRTGMELEYWKRTWEELGKDDPLWVVLTHESKRGGKWDVQEFFETGRAEIATVLGELAGLKLPRSRQRALDFGCGVGRLTQALAAEFEHADGVDISSTMIEHANGFNRWPDRCQFHVNASDDLRLFDTNSFDLIYSNIALQHIEPAYAMRYIAEFLRILKPGGVAVFQVLKATLRRRLFPQFLVDRYRAIKFKGAPYFGMFGLVERDLTRLILEGDGRIVSLTRSQSPDLGWRWISLRYVVEKIQ